MGKISVVESISGDKFATGSRINTHTAHVRELSLQKWSKTVSPPEMTACALNPNMTSDFKPGVEIWSKLKLRVFRFVSKFSETSDHLLHAVNVRIKV